MHECHLCGEKDLAEIKILRVYTEQKPINVCKRCGLVQVVKRRSSKEIYEAWMEATPGDDVYHSADAAVAARHAYVKAFVDTEATDMIDIGGGDGKFSRLYHYTRGQYCYNYNGMAEGLVNSKFYSVGFILWTLENCGDVNEFLRCARRAIKPGGELVVATGSRMLVPYKKPLWAYVGPGDQDLHSWRFTHNTLRAFLMKNGFQVQRVNDFRGCDYLVMVAKKVEDQRVREKYLIGVDNYRAVNEYFDCWHTYTQGRFPPPRRKTDDGMEKKIDHWSGGT